MKRILLIAFIGIGTLFQSCQDEGNTPEENKEYELPAPEIIISNPVPCINEEVGFSFKSDIEVEPAWSFGGEATSADSTAVHTFSKEGTFSINLKLSDGKGGTVSVDTTVSVMGRRLNDALEELISKPGGMWVCSHRGNTYYGQKLGNLPENSLEAIGRAIKAGAEMIEIDVRSTSDKKLVIMHDATIDRTTDGSGTVSDLTLAVLKRFRLKAESGNLTEYTIPTLEEALLAGRGKIFYELDIKSGVNIPALVHLVDSLHMLERVVFYRGSSQTKAKEVTDVNPQCIIFPFINTSTSEIEYWDADSRIKLVQIDYDNSSAGKLVAAAKSKGMASFTSYISDAVLTNDFSGVDKIRNLQFQIILTNYAEYVKPYAGK